MNIRKRLQASTLARNSLWMFIGYGVRIVLQAAYFLLIARALGTSGYGAFVGVTALVAIISPFAGLGTGNLLIKNVSRKKALFAQYWGNALFVTGVSGLVLLVAVMMFSRLLLPASITPMLVLLIAASDLICGRLSDIAAQAFQAVDQLRQTAALTLLPFALRTVAAAILYCEWHRTTPLAWGWFFLASSSVSCVFAVAFASRVLGAPQVALWRLSGELKEGFYFGTSLSAQTVYNDIDKTMLASMGTLDATGVYAAAYRVIDVSFLPIKSVLYAAYTNFFRQGQDGLRASYAYARRLLPTMVAYAAVVFAALFFAAPLLPVVLGREYISTVEALRWLALLPVFKCVHYFLADALTGAGYQGYRTAIQAAVAAGNVALNLWLIPTYSWRGAAWSSLGCDFALVMCYAAFVALVRRQKQGSAVLIPSADSARS